MSDRGLVAAAVAAFAAAFLAPTGLLVVAVVTASALLLSATLVRRPSLVYVAAVVVIGARAGASVEALGRPLPVRVDGVASLVADPRPGPFGESCVVRLGGRLWLAEVDRDHAWALKDLLTGDRVQLAGRTRSLNASNRGWVLANHLAGRISVSRIGDRGAAPPWFRLANVVHRRLSAGSTSFGDAGQSLFMGLVVGDDRNQDEVTGFRFRASGLGHLLAVSGQNVAFLLVVFRPLLERLSVRWRWLAVIAVLILFVLVTRAEPSVLRAAAMAGVAGVAASLGRVASGARIVGLSVLGLLLVDPLLAHSVGFQLSLGATIGLLVLARPLARVLPGPRWLADGLAVTLSAQAGTTPILMVVGGGVPSVATVANLLAVPAAGVVMTLGLTTGLAAGFVRADVASVLQVPTRLLVWWIDRVAVTASRAPMAVLDPLRLVLVVVAVISVVVANQPGPAAGLAGLGHARGVSVGRSRRVARTPGARPARRRRRSSGRTRGPDRWLWPPDRHLRRCEWCRSGPGGALALGRGAGRRRRGSTWPATLHGPDAGRRRARCPDGRGAGRGHGVRVHRPPNAPGPVVSPRSPVRWRWPIRGESTWIRSRRSPRCTRRSSQGTSIDPGADPR